MAKTRTRPTEAPPPPENTASTSWRSAITGEGNWDLTAAHRDKKKWQIFERGQEKFWAVPTVIDWEEPIREDPEYAESIAAMLGFLLPGEKAAVTAASFISPQLTSEEGKFYFVEQALEEAKHYEALRRVIPKITGRPIDPVKPSLRLLYTYGVIDRDDVAFMMGNVNIIGEHLANQIFFKIKGKVQSPQLKTLLKRISEDEARHIAAGKHFYPEVYPQFKKNRRKIMAKNLITLMILGWAAHDLVNPMRKLGIDLDQVLDKMYDHYDDVLSAFPSMPEQVVWDYIMKIIRKETPKGLDRIGRMTNEQGHIELNKMLSEAERALTSPRALRRLFA